MESKETGSVSGISTEKSGNPITKKPLRANEIRPHLMFQVASEILSSSRWPYGAAYLEFRSDQDEPGSFRMFCNANPGTIQDVTERKLDISMLNPEVIIKMAYNGTGPFDRPHPLAIITVIPHYDQLGFVVTKKSGITSLDQIRERRYPLRLSVRGSRDLATGMLVNEILKAHGFSFGDILDWGGYISYDQPMPNERLDLVKSGKVEAIFDEGIHRWANLIDGLGMRFLPIDEEHMIKLTAVGFKRGVIEKSLYPTLPSDVPTVDFSGWPIFTHTEAPDLLVTSFCEALEARKHSIRWQLRSDQEEPPLPLEQMCTNGEDTPLDIPLHRAAERFWRERGYFK